MECWKFHCLCEAISLSEKLQRKTSLLILFSPFCLWSQRCSLKMRHYRVAKIGNSKIKYRFLQLLWWNRPNLYVQNSAACLLQVNIFIWGGWGSCKFANEICREAQSTFSIIHLLFWFNDWTVSWIFFLKKTYDWRHFLIWSIVCIKRGHLHFLVLHTSHHPPTATLPRKKAGLQVLSDPGPF